MNTIKSCRSRGMLQQIFLYLTAILMVYGPAAGMALAGRVNPDAIDVLALPEDSPELFAVTAPALTQVQGGENETFLLSASSSPKPETADLLERLDSLNFLVLTSDSKTEDKQISFPKESDSMQISQDFGEASLEIARKFWGHTDKAVLTSKSDRRAIIQGSALAAHLEVPLIVSGEGRRDEAVKRTLNELQVDKIFQVKEEGGHANYRTDELEQDIEHLKAIEAQERVTAEIGKENAAAVVLTRVPGEENAASWLAPYYSLKRNAPIAMTGSSDTDSATSEVMRLIEDNDITPRSVAILGDEESISRKTVRVGDVQNDGGPDPDAGDGGDDQNEPLVYEVEVEPCMPENTEEIPSFGVGRIPFSSAQQAATFLTRGFVREQLLAETDPQAMMAANADSVFRGLPLSETMARLSAAEFENVELKIEDFYGDSISKEKAEKTARQANLIIYHGHTGHEDFLPDSPSPRQEQESDHISSPEGEQDYHHEERDDEEMHDPEFPHPDQLEDNRQDTLNDYEALEEPPEHSHHDALESQEEKEEDKPEEKEVEAPSDQLKGLPVVILQSCSSLGQRFFDKTNPFGAAAKIGTDTSMHSASGTAFIKMFADSVLYRDANLGEALRYARKYFILMQTLKDARDHTQQPKSQRAALSFQLWGDPELRVFPQGIDKPRQKPAEVEFAGSDPAVLEVSMPSVEDKKVQTEDYFATFYPEAQVAGIVRRVDDDEPRRVAPIHFFRKQLPEGIDKPSSGRLYVEDNDSIDAFYEIENKHKQLSVIFYPEKRYYTDETYRLKFPKEEKDNEL